MGFGAKGADLVLLPGVWNTGWLSFDLYCEYSEYITGKTISRIAEKAKIINVCIKAGNIIEKAEDELYNSAVLSNPKSKIIAKHRKMPLVTMIGA